MLHCFRPASEAPPQVPSTVRRIESPPPGKPPLLPSRTFPRGPSIRARWVGAIPSVPSRRSVGSRNRFFCPDIRILLPDPRNGHSLAFMVGCGPVRIFCGADSRVPSTVRRIESPPPASPPSFPPGLSPSGRASAPGGPGQSPPCPPGALWALWAVPIARMASGPRHPGERFRSGTVARDHPASPPARAAGGRAGTPAGVPGR